MLGIGRVANCLAFDGASDGISVLMGVEARFEHDLLAARLTIAGQVMVKRLHIIIGSLAISIAYLGVVANDSLVAMELSAEEASRQLEYTVKLAYLCNFGHYVEWPSNADSEKDNSVWVIGVLGDAPFREAVEELAASGRKINGRPVAVRRLASLDDYQPCHILFVVKTVPPEQQEAIIKTLRGQPILLVGEIADFTTQGGCIGFYREGENVRFEVNLDAIRDCRLQLSAKLLGVAKIVR